MKPARRRISSPCLVLAAAALCWVLPAPGDEAPSVPPETTLPTLPSPPPTLPPAPLLRTINTDVPPYDHYGIQMAPLRPVASFLGIAVDYADGILTLVRHDSVKKVDITITLRTGGSLAQVDSAGTRHTLKLPVPAEERMGTVFIPLRIIVEAFGGTVGFMPEGGLNIINIEDRSGVLTPIAQEGYRGKDAIRVTINNRLPRALSLRLTGPGSIAVELGPYRQITRSMKPGVYYYRAACFGMKTRTGVRRLLAGRKATWVWEGR